MFEYVIPSQVKAFSIILDSIVEFATGDRSKDAT